METKEKEQKTTATKKVTTQKNDNAKNSAAVVKSILTPSAESRIKKLDNFGKLAERHQLLTQKRDELESFKVASDSLNEKIELVNGMDKFKVSNSVVINKVKELMSEELDALIEKSEKEIVNFDI